MYQKYEKRNERPKRKILFLWGILGTVLLSTVAANAVEPVIYFSTEESFTATAGPHAGQVISHGDLLSTTGRVIARNSHLIRNFGPMPPPPDYGLDGVYLRPSGEILFSIEDTFWDEGLSTWVKHGDLLSDIGVILQTNPQLLRNFGPMPSPDPDYGLDALDERSANEIWFSIEEGFWDEVLGTNVRHGDLLSDLGSIIMTNAQLLINFFPMPAPNPDYGLDAVHAFGSGAIWFSIEDTFWDEVRGTWIQHGDLLSTGPTGTVIKTNAQLLAAFFGGAGNVTQDYGLDAVWVVPEPATMGLVTLCVLALLRKKK